MSYIPGYQCAPNYQRPTFSPVGKPEPRIVAKVAKRKAVARMDRNEKEAVRQRDKEACRVCFRHSREVHERLFKSLGGVASMRNSMCACRLCHTYLQGHAIKPFCLSDEKGCSGLMKFQMSKEVARQVFRGAMPPKHVEVLP